MGTRLGDIHNVGKTIGTRVDMTRAHSHRWETNGVAEGAVRRVKEGSTVAFVPRGLPDEWWGCAVECYSYLRNLQDRTADGQTTFRKSFGKIIDGPSTMPANIITGRNFFEVIITNYITAYSYRSDFWRGQLELDNSYSYSPNSWRRPIRIRLQFSFDCFFVVPCLFHVC